jgi:hypothetical protein
MPDHLDLIPHAPTRSCTHKARPSMVPDVRPLVAELTESDLAAAVEDSQRRKHWGLRFHEEEPQAPKAEPTTPLWTRCEPYVGGFAVLCGSLALSAYVWHRWGAIAGCVAFLVCVVIVLGALGAGRQEDEGCGGWDDA